MRKRELLYSVTKKDFTIQTFRSGGPGGQHQNKTDSGVRITHNESGAVGECRETPSQAKNKKTAFKRCVESLKFKKWNNLKAMDIINKQTVAEKVDDMMDEKNITTEHKVDGLWVKED